MNPYVLSLLAIATGAVLIYALSIIQGKPTRRICLKLAVNGMINIALFITFVLSVMGCMLFIPAFMEYMVSKAMYVGTIPGASGAVAMAAIAMLLMGCIIFLVGLVKIPEYRAWKFTDEEEKLLTQDFNKNITTHPRLAKFFRLKTKPVEGGLSIRPLGV